ncbi:MAG: hypothetical protein Q8O34_13795 [Rhodocyclaceae bacterium]|nr:hypothetical protein [Rhodocyclaceae bacterium]
MDKPPLLRRLFHLAWPVLIAQIAVMVNAVISWITVSIAWGWCARRVDCEGYAVFARWSWPSAARIGSLLRLGLPIGATQFVDVTAFTFMALFIARLGPAASAAHQIASNLAVLAIAALYTPDPAVQRAPLKRAGE